MKILLRLAVIAGLIACGNNAFDRIDKTRDTPEEEAINALNEGDPEKAYNTLYAVMPANIQEMISTINPSDATFISTFKENISTLDNEQKKQMLIMGKAKIEMEGIDPLPFFAELTKLDSSSNGSLRLAATCPDPNIKLLIESVKSGKNPLLISYGRFLVIAGAYAISIKQMGTGSNTFDIAVYSPNGVLSGDLKLTVSFSALIDFAMTLKNIDSNSDAKISQAEADAYFSGDLAFARANLVYDILSIAVTTIDAFIADKISAGEDTTDIKKAQTQISKYQNSLLTTTLSNTAKTCGSERTKESTIDCAIKFIVAISGCK